MNTTQTKISGGGKAAGYILGAIGAASYGLNPTFALPLYADGMNPDSVLLLRYGLAIPLVALMILLRGQSFKVARQSILPLAGLGLMMTMSSLMLFISYNYMAAGIASTILFVYPLIVALIMTLFCHEKLTMQTILCILLATSGIVMMYNLGNGQTLSLKGTLIVLASALAYALYLVAVNQKRIAGIATLTVSFYVLIVGTTVFAGRIVCGVSELTLPGSPLLWLDAVALSVFPTIISLACTTRAIQLVGSTPTAILGALEPVTAVIMGILLFNEGMTAREAFGILMILVAVSFVIAGGSLSGSSIIRHLTRFRQMFPKIRKK